MSESNRGALYYVAESTWGETPSGPPTLKAVRRTGGTFGQNPSHSTSAEVRSDRMVADLIRTGIAPAGTIDFEVSYGAHDDLYEGVFCSTWSTGDTTNGSLTTVAASGTVTMTGAFTDAVVGQWFEIENSANNDGFYRIATRTSADEVIVSNKDELGSDATAEAGVDILFDGMLRNGTTLKSFTFEEQYQDVSQGFFVYRGMVLGSVSLNINADQIVTGTFGDMMGGTATDGVVAVERKTATVGDGSPTAAAANSIVNAVDHIYSIREGGSANAVLASGLTFTLTNNLRGLPAIGNLGPADINLGTVGVTGQFTGYYGADANTMVDKLLADTASSQSFRIMDGAGNTYIWTFPALKYTAGTPEMGGLDADVPVNLTFTGYSDGDTMIQLDRFAANP